MTGGEALAAAIVRLRAAGVPDPARDARRLLAHALGVNPGRLTLILPDPVPDLAQAAFKAALTRRAAREPVSHILGRRAFFGREFRVTRDVLDPRPETEILVKQALGEDFSSLLDLGTGSGCILLSLLAERPAARGLGVDICDRALEVARENARALGIARAEFARSDWFGNVSGRFGLIVSNPPYIAAAEMAALAPELRQWEPEIALTPGGDGLEAYRRIAAGVRAHLLRGGRLLVEIGPTQGGAVSALVAQAGFQDLRVYPDLDGRDRVIAARAP
ncbi:[protein release factor]-glutamine N5-methyltransferase [Rhodovulum imhoffii]|uniref:Release factor glutamine methyltransferase n=1 Tax=Rhodovulum imhoffii TaxID=365340 RepID=A0A2T5BVL3_9RHOB|nr:peptide chain release factor N(5)-glutamine methyltransferase [Rhodovulum imhoffii]MBK5932812.1 protein-(glutamine-N5) methyltransferase, release factor-specific [Rhodovulum imhoffii]PTN03619.1 [protein release factor]-glutamine N5-methyltransferase [Rhodovulum imhoffii]